MPMAEIVFKAFQKILFKPLLDIAAKYNAQIVKDITILPFELKNADVSPLVAALRTGLVQYKDGVFTGSFNRAISAALRSIGADLHKPTKTYRIDASLIPPLIRSEAVMYEAKAREAHEAIFRELNKIQTNLEPTFEKFELNADPTFDAIEKGFKESARALGVYPELTAKSKEILSEEYSENMKLYIKKFTEEAIHSVREQTEKNAVAGFRFDRLAAILQDQYKVSAAKAEFLARTETSIFMSKFHEMQYAEAGVTRYVWQTAGDQRVRDDHKYLNGKTFFFSQPPIADKATGTRANPGAIWNCRCVARPILDPVGVNA